MKMLTELNEKLENEKELESNYGDVDNFSYLIKWERTEYAQSTWEDEFVLSRFPD